MAFVLSVLLRVSGGCVLGMMLWGWAKRLARAWASCCAELGCTR